ncbi:hypothetical protein BDZ45DRAFT_748085 [Acephala macrosclerotiorum]|nr:hypothetical protein BDZ45DRAFT_748085 [Acephala macrosclerotiorum]
MRLSKQVLLAILLVTYVLTQAKFESSSKRGLVFTPAKSFPGGDKIWIKPSSDLTCASIDLQWHRYSACPYVQRTRWTIYAGGCQMNASLAAETWEKEKEIVPLQKMGIKADFYGNCTSCKPDFIPLHYYGDYKGFAAYISSVVSLHPNVPIWVTEYAYDHQNNLQTSQDFFNTSAKYLDSSTNVGPNAALLTVNGSLTDVGSWYLGGAATNNIPSGPPGSEASRKPIVSGALGSALPGVMAMHWIFSC